jgi:glyoxylase-like metal-dependent hydrolase (beta-lactamase superfamily II)
MKRIAPNIYASTDYPGVNVGFVVLPEGAIAIDAPTLPRDARAWRERIIKMAHGPILYALLTDAHPDRMLSVGLLEAPVVATRAAHDRAADYTDGFWRGVVESWTRRHPQAANGLNEVPHVLPEILVTDSLTLHKGGKDVVIEQVAGGAPGSAWIFFDEQNVLFSGDIVVVGVHPFLEASVDTKAWLNTLKAVRRERYAKTTIVPGRGPLCDQSSSRPLSEYIALARRRARSLQTAGRARVDKAAAVAELLSLLPVSDDELDIVQRRIKAGLDKLCEEVE